jgi:hypothetical protein
MIYLVLLWTLLYCDDITILDVCVLPIERKYVPVSILLSIDYFEIFSGLSFQPLNDRLASDLFRLLLDLVRGLAQEDQDSTLHRVHRV